MTEVFNRLARQRVLPAIVLPSAAHAVPCGSAVQRGGIDVLEVTFRSEDAAEAVAKIRSEFPDLICGAGTLLNPRDVDAAIAAGAQFGLSPGFNPATVRAATAAGLPFIPGVQTAGEIEQALELGCTWVKFFPAEMAGGVKLLQAIMPPYRHTPLRIVPLGGVNPSNARTYLELDFVPAIGGSWLTPMPLLIEQRYDEITRLCREAMTLVQNVTQ